MTFSKPFLIALAALPMALASSDAQAAPRCKFYNKIIKGPNGNDVATAKICRDENNHWYFKTLKGSEYSRIKLADKIYFDLRDKGYGVLIDYRPSVYGHQPYRYRPLGYYPANYNGYRPYHSYHGHDHRYDHKHDHDDHHKKKGKSKHSRDCRD